MATSKPTVEKKDSISYDDFVPVMLEQKTGVWIEEGAFTDLLAGIVRERGELQGKIEAQKVLTHIEQQRNAELERSLGDQMFKTVWLPILTFVGGALVTGAVATGVYYGMNR